MFRVLICGLPGSGKTSLASSLQKSTNAVWFNADNVRSQFNDWSFDRCGRKRQSIRMRNLCDLAELEGKEIAICDFVAPTSITRNLFSPHFVVFMDTISTGRFSDTNRIFVPPTSVDFTIQRLEDIPGQTERLAKIIRKHHERRLDV